MDSVKQNCYRHRGQQLACVARLPTSESIVIITDRRGGCMAEAGDELTCMNAVPLRAGAMRIA